MTPDEKITKLAEVIAREIECEKICAENPSGCGCSTAAAQAALLFLATLSITPHVLQPEEPR